MANVRHDLLRRGLKPTAITVLVEKESLGSLRGDDLVEKQTRTYTKPISITDGTLAGIRGMVNEAQAKARAGCARANDLTMEQVEAIASGQECASKEPWECRIIARELHEIGQPDYSLRFKDGSAVDSSNFTEVVEAMQSRSVSPDKLTVKVGRYSYCNVDFTIWNLFSRSAEWDIRGSRADVRDLDRMLLDLVANSEPDYVYLHHRWRWAVVYLCSAIMLHIGFVFAVVLLPINEQARAVGTSVSPLFFLAALPTAYFVADRYEKLFPLVEFRYGRSARRRTAKRAFLFQIVTVALIPIVLAALPSLWTEGGTKSMKAATKPVKHATP